MCEDPVVGLFYFPNTKKLSIWSMTRKDWVQFSAVSAEPLPPGAYFVGPAGRHARLGEAAPLFPQCGTANLPDSWRRSGLFVHGGSGSATTPGIVLPAIAIVEFLAMAEALRAIWSDRLAIKVLPGAAADRQTAFDSAVPA